MGDVYFNSTNNWFCYGRFCNYALHFAHVISGIGNDTIIQSDKEKFCDVIDSEIALKLSRKV